MPTLTAVLKLATRVVDVGKPERADGVHLQVAVGGVLSEVEPVEGNETFMTGDTKYTDGIAQVQHKVDDTCANFADDRQSLHMTNRDGRGGENEDLGLRLDQVLEKHGLNRSKWSRKLGISASAIQKWKNALSAGDMTATTWNTCANALQSVGIDPKEVRPGTDAPSKTAVRVLVEPVMAITDRAMLELLNEVLTLEDSSDREMLRLIVKALLSKPR
jgi:hypothetical protein